MKNFYLTQHGIADHKCGKNFDMIANCECFFKRQVRRKLHYNTKKNNNMTTIKAFQKGFSGYPYYSYFEKT